MAGRIPQQFIDDLIQRVDIVEVIDSRVPLKKAGREFEACCPFHNEKTPSFKVNPNKQFYHCFGCKAGGSVVNFLMEHDHMEFVEAIEELAKFAGVKMPENESGQSSYKPKRYDVDLYDLLGQCDQFYRQQLRQHPQASTAVEYLKNRGVSGEIAKTFNIGFAPAKNSLVPAFPTPMHPHLVTTGMLIEKDNNPGDYFDRFRDRIMFPIRDARGRILGFGGRIIPSDTPNPKLAKYLNSPETPIFHKGRELYGLYEARQSLRDIDLLLVVEGYMDVIALAQQGIAYAVATLGTATTEDHLKRMFRLTDKIVFCFDGDRAGRVAAWRALEHVLPIITGTKQIQFMFLPDGEDPDSMVRSIGKEAFEKDIDNAQSLSQFFFSSLRDGISRHDLEAHRTLIDKARPYIENLTDNAYQSLLVRDLASYTPMDEHTVRQLLGLPQTRNSAPRVNHSQSQKLPPSLVRILLQYLLFEPKLASCVKQPSNLSHIQQPGIGLFIEILEKLQLNPTLTTAGLLEQKRDTEQGAQLEKLAVWQPSLDTPELLEQEFLGALERLESKHHSDRTEALLEKAKHTNLEPDEENELQSLLQR